MVVHRRRLRETLSMLLSLLRDKTPVAEVIALHGNAPGTGEREGPACNCQRRLKRALSPLPRLAG